MEKFEKEIEQMLDNIRKKRKEKGISQEQIAAHLGISQNSYKNIELGKTELKVKVLFSIMDFLGMDFQSTDNSSKTDLVVLEDDFKDLSINLKTLTGGFEQVLERQDKTEEELAEIKSMLLKLLTNKTS